MLTQKAVSNFWRLGVVFATVLVPLLSAGCSSADAVRSAGGSGGTDHATGGVMATGGTMGTGGAAVSPGTGGSVSVGTGGAAVAAGSGGVGTGGAAGTGGSVGSGGLAAGGNGNGSGGTASGGRGGLGAPNGTGGAAGRSGSGGAPAGTGGTPVTGGPSYPYIFSVFNDSQVGNTTLLIYTSTDALNFKLLYDTKYGGPSGTLRDPSIMKHTDGKFYIAFTTPPDAGCCGPESSFAIASSANLKDWTTVTTVPAGVAGVKNTWAPEWFKDKDGSIYALVNVDGKTYRYKALNDSLNMFSAPTWIGIGPGYIDTFIVTIGDTYHAFTKNSATYIEHATSTSLDGPWTFVGQNDWAGWGAHREAAALIQLDNGTWRFFCDGGSQGHEMSSDSADMFKTWTPLKTLPGVGNAISHGTVIKGN